ncbi:MAG: ribosome biogenesis GTP-binding protein YihA/YsxC [Gemmatimonadota bacterium]
MRIREIELAAVLSRPGGKIPDDLPQIVLVGRSNVGKSSLLNTIAGRRRLAPISSTPGKTQGLYFYRVNGRLYLVDLPGYGFARVPGFIQRRWQPLIEGYLTGAHRLCGAVLLLDARHRPSEDDRWMAAYLAELGLATLFVLTKIDKLKRTERRRQTEEILEALEVASPQAVWFSAKTGEGKVHLLKKLSDWVRTSERAEAG